MIVTDLYALYKAENELGEYTKIELTQWSDARRISNSVKSSNGKETLIIMPPLKTITSGEWRYLKKICEEKIIRIRLHPLDKNNKENHNILESNNINGNITERDIVEEMSKSKEVVGFDSYALYIAMLSKKKTYIIREETESGEALKWLKANLDIPYQK